MPIPILILLAMILGFTACQKRTGTYQDLFAAHVIYGKDTRQDLSPANLSGPAAATAVLFGEDQMKRSPMTLGQAYPLCEGEKFQDQVLLGHCSGVLVGTRHVLTAGHCMRDQAQCANTLMAFGYTGGGLKPESIYKCARILKREDTPSRGGHDYALIELDREVKGVLPVSKGDVSKLKAGDVVFSFSYPLGLPLKMDQGVVHRNESWSTFIEAGVDTFSGSSGSGLFNAKGELVGILSSGSEDLLEDEVYDVQRSGGCLRFNRCEESGTCRSERFYKML